jgi:hypothetical protein
MNYELETILKEVIVTQSRYYHRIYLEGLNKTTKTLNQNSRLPGQESNRIPVNTSPERYRYIDQYGACFRNGELRELQHIDW